MEEELNTVIQIPKKPKKRFNLKEWWQSHKPTKRRLIQVYVALLTNANIKGYINGRIYTGKTKALCTPGLNCYSCPGAVASCPLGSLQNAFAQSGTRAPYYVIGIILLLCITFARTICGFFCPVGLGQELLYKIKTAKLKKNKVTYILSYLKYVLLAVFIIALPLAFGLFGAGAPKVPAFCKYICPAGTFGGALGLLSNPNNEGMFAQLGPLFTFKFCVMVSVIVACIFIYRCFCRFLCPLGAIYGFFNKFAFFGIKLDKNKCTDCGLCVAHCKMDIKHVGDHECINCGECISVCPAKAISFKGSQIFIHPNAIQTPPEEQKPLNALMLKPAAATSGGGTISLTPSATPCVLHDEDNTPQDNIPQEDIKSGRPQPAQNSPAPCARAARIRPDKAQVLKIVAVVLAAVLLIGSLVYFNFIDKGDKSAGVEAGDPCPEFTVELYSSARADGGSLTLSQLSGKIVLVNFWGTWCGPCVAELPYFNKVKTEYADKIEVIAVHSNFRPEDVQNYLNVTSDPLNQGVLWSDWNIYFAQNEGEDVTYKSLGGKDSWPTTLIIDGNGNIAFIREGSITYAELCTQIEALI